MSEYGEPWTYNNTYEVLLNCDGRLITQIHNGFGSPPVMDWEPCGDGREELRRITACVNACAGIDTECLESHGPGSIANLLRSNIKAKTIVDRQIHEQIIDFAEEVAVQIIRDMRVHPRTQTVIRKSARAYAAERFPATQPVSQ